MASFLDSTVAISIVGVGEAEGCALVFDSDEELQPQEAQSATIAVSAAVKIAAPRFLMYWSQKQCWPLWPECFADRQGRVTVTD